MGIISRHNYQSLMNHIGDGEEWGLELEEGSHRNHTVHPVYPITQDHPFLILSSTLRKRSRIEKERQKTVKSRIVTKAKGRGREIVGTTRRRRAFSDI